MTCHVVCRERKTPVLTPSALPCLARTPAVNFTAGCAHGCLYCYARGYRNYPGDGRVALYANTFEKLRRELPRKRRTPQCVYFSPSTDPFQPLPAQLDMAYEVFGHLLERGVGVAFLTKGRIPERCLRLFERFPELVRGQVGAIALDEALLAVLEPAAPPPRVRLAQAQRLIQAGVAVSLRADPILPGLTDGYDTLGPLMAAAAEAGISDVSVNTPNLKPWLLDDVLRKLAGTPYCTPLRSAFRHARPTRSAAGTPGDLVLPAHERAAIYSRAAVAAGAYGLRTHVCGCKNPDLTDERCNLTGDWPEPAPRAEQLDLFALQPA